MSDTPASRNRSRSRERAAGTEGTPGSSRKHTFGSGNREGRRASYDRDPRFDGDRRAAGTHLVDMQRGRKREFEGRGGGARKQRNKMELKHDDIPTGLLLIAQQAIASLGDMAEQDYDRESLPQMIQEMEEVLSMPQDLLRDNPDGLADLLVKCMSKLSVQSPICATLLAAIYADEREDRRHPCRTLVCTVVDELQRLVLSSLKDNDIRRAKLALRSLSILARLRVVPVDGTCGIGQMISVLLDVIEGGCEAADVAAYLAGATLLWSADDLIATWEPGLVRAQQTLAKYNRDRICPYDITGVHAVFHSDIRGQDATSGSCGDSIGDITSAACAAVEQAIQRSYVLPYCILQPWSKEPPSIKPDLTLDILVPSLVSALSVSKLSDWNIPLMTLFEDDPDDPAIPEPARCSARLSNPTKCLLRDYIQDIVHFFDPIVRKDGTKIGSVATLARHLVALNRLLPEGSGEGVQAYLVVEILLGIIVQQPSKGPAFPFRMTFDLCQEEKHAVARSSTQSDTCHIPTALAYGTQYLFLFAAAMDAFSLRQLIDWLALHLSNYKLVWPFWLSWEEELKDCDEGQAQEQFVKILVRQLAMHIQRESLQEQLKPGLRVFIPETSIVSMYLPQTENDDGVESKDICVNESMRELARELHKRVQEREDAEDVKDFLDQNHENVADVIGIDTWRAHMLMHVVLFAGHKTITHTISFIDKYRSLLQDFAYASPENERRMLEAVTEAWVHSPWHVGFIVDALMRRAVLTPSTVADWAFQDTHLSSLHIHTWYIDWIRTVVERTLDNVRAALRRQLLQQHDGVIASDPSTATAVKDEPQPVAVVQSSALEEKGTEQTDSHELEREEDDNEDSAKRRRVSPEDQPSLPPAHETTEHVIVAGQEHYEATQHAIDLARCVSRTSITRLAQKMKEHASASRASSHYQLALDPLYNASFSVLRWVLRSYVTAQHELLAVAHEPIVLLDMENIGNFVSSDCLSVVAEVWAMFSR